MPVQTLIYLGKKSGALYLLPKRCLDLTGEISIHVLRQAQSFIVLCLTPC